MRSERRRSRRKSAHCSPPASAEDTRRSRPSATNRSFCSSRANMGGRGSTWWSAWSCRLPRPSPAWPPHGSSWRYDRASDARLTYFRPARNIMHGFKGERTLMRIYVGERDKVHGRPLYEAIVVLLRNRHYAGATVLRATMGFGASSHLRTDRIEVLSSDLPIVIECVETAERIQAILPELDTMIGGVLITLERANVIMYRPHDQSEEGADDWSLDLGRA